MQNSISLNQNKDFLRLYYRGKSCVKPALVVYSMKNRVGLCRVGITTSKKIGNAVNRNRSRRLIRAAWHNVQKNHDIKGNYDFVFVARARTKFLKSTQIEKQMLDALVKLGVLGWLSNPVVVSPLTDHFPTGLRITPPKNMECHALNLIYHHCLTKLQIIIF